MSSPPPPPPPSEPPPPPLLPPSNTTTGAGGPASPPPDEYQGRGMRHNMKKLIFPHPPADPGEKLWAFATRKGWLTKVNRERSKGLDEQFDFYIQLLKKWNETKRVEVDCTHPMMHSPVLEAEDQSGLEPIILAQYPWRCSASCKMVYKRRAQAVPCDRHKKANKKGSREMKKLFFTLFSEGLLPDYRWRGRASDERCARDE
eukprot:Hpha_TRINITY_DN8700_c0_g2::TRINITY_DN8700_c0_g2_i1::g.45183::m.45183